MTYCQGSGSALVPGSLVAGDVLHGRCKVCKQMVPTSGTNAALHTQPVQGRFWEAA